MSDSLWGDLPLNEKIITPKIIFEQQAAALTTQTKGFLEGKIVLSKSSEKDNIIVKLLIKAPSLNNYVYEVVGVVYPIIELYPSKLWQPNNEFPDIANDEDELKNFLREILQSDRVRRAIRGLLAQIDENDI